ncbi:MAG: OmpA family protein [Thiomargarita sp.]|nr:OmpA family protein [Thiomargarita sp.]
MFNYSSRKTLIGVVTGTLLSAASISVVTADDTHHLIDSRGEPIRTSRANECVQTPNVPNIEPRLRDFCGDIIDKDKDGVNDSLDNCPDNTSDEISQGVYDNASSMGRDINQAAKDASNQEGCPVDTDSDKVQNYRDDCPDNTPLEIEAGVDARGCPLDTDQDAVPDYKDQCPNTVLGAAVDEYGCRIINKTAIEIILPGDVTFAFGKSGLTSQAQATLQTLVDETGVDFIETIQIVGHTDSIGSEKYNQKLSEKRAIEVAEYIISLGLPTEKVTQWGEGESNPIGPNNTKKGRATNRRVEIEIKQIKRREVN